MYLSLMQNDRALWAAVVLQARDDIAEAPLGSVEYGQAEAFFRHAGRWGESRAAIADQLGVHADDLARLGRAAIAARRAAEGLPPETIRPRAKVVLTPPKPVKPAAPPPPAPKPPVVWPKLIVTPPPANDDQPPRIKRVYTRRQPHEHGRLRHVFNPHNPLLQQRA